MLTESCESCQRGTSWASCSRREKRFSGQACCRGRKGDATSGMIILLRIQMLYKKSERVGNARSPRNTTQMLHQRTHAVQTRLPSSPRDILESPVGEREEGEMSLNTSVIRKIELLHRIQTEYRQRQQHLQQTISANRDTLKQKRSPSPQKSTGTRQSNRQLMERVQQMEELISKLTTQSIQEEDQGNYRVKYRAQKQKNSVLEGEKEGLELLLRLIKEEYEEYRRTAESILSDSYLHQEETKDLGEQVTKLRRMLLSKNSEVQLAKQENNLMANEIAALKLELELESQKEKHPHNEEPVNQSTLQEKEELRQELFGFQSINAELVQRIHQLQNSLEALKQEQELYLRRMNTSNFKEMYEINQKLLQKIEDLETKIQLQEASELQTVRLYDAQIVTLKSQNEGDLTHLNTDLELCREESSNLERLLHVIRLENQSLSEKCYQLENSLSEYREIERVVKTLQQRLEEENQNGVKKSSKIVVLEGTISEYRDKVEELNQEFREVLHVGQAYGFEGSVTLHEWVSQQLRDYQRLGEVNNSLKMTLNNLNKEIQQKWIKEKISDMEEIQRLRELLLKPNSHPEQQSGLLEVIKEQSKDEHNSQIFRNKLIAIKKSLEKTFDRSEIEDNLLDSEESYPDLELSIHTLIDTIKRYILELISSLSRIEDQNQHLVTHTHQLQTTITQLKEQLGSMSTFILQKEELISLLQKQKNNPKNSLASLAEVPIDYSQKSISFRLERENMLVAMESRQELRATIRVRMREIIGEYLDLDNDVFTASIEDLFVDIYQVSQSPEILVSFEKFLKEVRLFSRIEEKKKSGIQHVLGDLIRRSNEIMESEEELLEEKSRIPKEELAPFDN